MRTARFKRTDERAVERAVDGQHQPLAGLIDVKDIF